MGAALKNDPEKHADEFEDFRGSTVCGFGLLDGRIVTMTVPEVEPEPTIRGIKYVCTAMFDDGVYKPGANGWEFVRPLTEDEKPKPLRYEPFVTFSDRPHGPSWIRAE